MNQQTQISQFKKVLVFSVLAVFVSIILLSIFKHREAYRLYKVITLFDEENIVENFQRMSDIFPAATAAKGKANLMLTNSALSLPDSFAFQDSSYSISEYLKSTYTTGFIVIKDNQIVFETYDRNHSIDGLHISWSVNKSFVSALIGIALEEGFIKSIKDPVDQYSPILKGTGYEGVPLEDVLQMSSGVAFNEDYTDFHSDINRMGRVIALGNSINEFAASLKSDKPSGTFHHYVSMDTQVLGIVLKDATGQSPTKYLEDKIWKKLGMRSDAKWLVDDQDMELAFGTLNATLRDYARFGILFQNYGEWMGEQIIPRQWVIDSVTATKPHLKPGDNEYSSSKFGYGYQWWLPPKHKNDFMARGVYGQYIYVNPEEKVVIVKHSADPFWRAGSEENYKTTAMFQSITASLSSNQALKENQSNEETQIGK